ncbi:MAG: PAS domain-containing protein, partial [Anaerolineae bacterium]|nr:PAS domain-containing protein [Anaerolineae bacterium]
PDIYYRTDAQGLVAIMSPAIYDFLGYRPEELIGKQLSTLYVDPENRDRFLQRLKEEGGKLYGFENRLYRKDGDIVWGMASSQYCFDEAGHFVGVEGIV